MYQHNNQYKPVNIKPSKDHPAGQKLTINEGFLLPFSFYPFIVGLTCLQSNYQNILGELLGDQGLNALKAKRFIKRQY